MSYLDEASLEKKPIFIGGVSTKRFVVRRLQSTLLVVVSLRVRHLQTKGDQNVRVPCSA